MKYVTDTHSLVWYFTEDSHLSIRALDVFETSIKGGTIIVPSIVLAEIMFIAKKGKISLTFKETLRRIQELENFNIAPLDAGILKIADKIEVDMEMHDRLITATALHFKAAIITKDERIRNIEICPIVW